MEFPQRKQAQHDEERQYRGLRDDKRRLGLLRRKMLKECHLLEALHDEDEEVEIQCSECGRDIDKAPPPGEAIDVKRQQRDEKNGKRQDADSERGRETVIGKKKPVALVRIVVRRKIAVQVGNL